MQRDSSAARFYHYTFLGLAAISLVLQAVSLGPLRDSLWGFHLYAFLPPVVSVISWSALFVAALGLARFFARRRRHQEGEPQAEKETPTRAIIHFVKVHPVRSSLVLAVVCAALFWLLRSRQLLLGDALPLTEDLAAGHDFHPRQPLTMWIQQLLYGYLGPVFRVVGTGEQDVAQAAVALGSVIAGFFYVLVAAALGRMFARETSHGSGVAWLATLILLSQGFMQLFFGYVENYTYYTLAISIYLWLSLRFLRGLSPLLLPGLALIVALTLHLSAVVLLPSFVVLGVWGLAVRGKRLSTLVDLAVSAALVIAVNQLLIDIRDYNLLAVLFDISGRVLGARGDLIPNYMFSAGHVRDFLNEQYLIGPLALFMWVPAVVIAVRMPDRGSISTLFLITVGSSYLAASWLAGDSNLGYARNWDLLAPAGVCYTVVALYFLLKHVPQPEAAVSVLKFGLVFSILHLAPWVWINHNEDLALQRFKTLPLGLGRTEVVVGNWYLRHDQLDEAALWFRRAVETNPNNGPAYAFLGMLATRQNRLQEASLSYERAVALRPDKAEFRHNYLITLLELNRLQEALPHLEWFTRTLPDNGRYWRHLRDVLSELGRGEDLIPVHERLLVFAEETLGDDPGNENANVEAAICLMHLHREEEALMRFRRALQTNPSSAAAMFHMAWLLIRQGQGAEAQPVLHKFIELYPDHPNAAWVRKHLRP
ncbi:MAG: tetratricopeptide repeat protein [Candidatus Krumholzibacteria bacterium]|nr:tetratricopeptide repeat protein [Candidatus Krumholzibacteria bacterium]